MIIERMGIHLISARSLAKAVRLETPKDREVRREIRVEIPNPHV